MHELTIDPELAIQIVAEDNNPIAYDTETDGVEVTSKAVGYVITNQEYSIYVPVRHEPGGNIPNGEAFEAELASAFRERGRSGYRTVGHNLGFDLRISLRRGIELRYPLEDTMINELLIDDRTRGYGLEESCVRRQVTPKKGEALYSHIAARFGGLPDRKQMANFWRMPGDDELVFDYAVGDGISTLELWRVQQRILDAEDLRRAWELECQLLPYLARMHHRGMKVDMEYGASLLSEDGLLETQIREAKSVFPAGFNPRSSSQVEALFRRQGYGDDDFDRTENGKPSFTEKWLSRNEIGEAIIKWRQLEKCRDSFILPIVERNNIEGRLHPILHQSKSDDYGVAGSRLSCSGPNMQAQPKRNKTIGKIVRPLVIPDDDMVIEEGDFKQQEPRLFAHYSACEPLIKGYRSGQVDIHDIASKMTGLPRDTAKRLGLGILTGMGVRALAGHMGWSQEEAKAAHRKFLYDAFPEIYNFQKKATAIFASRGYVASIMGRRARLESQKTAYVAVSRIIQNSGGEHMKLALLRANQYEDAYPDKVQILLSIHDSTIWQRDPGHDVSELVKVIEGVAEELKLAVPIPIDLGSGRNWGEASYGK